MADTKLWQDLTTEEKIAKLEKQLEKILTARQLVNELSDEFEQLTRDWIKKVKKYAKTKDAK